MNRARALSSNRTPLLVPAVAAIFFTAASLMAQQVVHLAITQPGGMPGLPVMTGIKRVTNGVQVTWDGPSGYYQVYQKSNRLTAPWVALGKATNLVRYAVITKLYSNAFFRVSGPSPQYIGDQACAGCHDNIRNTDLKTRHARAFTNTTFTVVNRTVGYLLPGGFISQAATPQLAGVQCENCHGPAANHAANENDPTVRPRVELAATVCGGCHTGPMHPTYEEWNTSGHAAVVPDALLAMSSSTTNISSCGRCHSGSVRLALINRQNPVALTNDLDVAITCAVCHDPHQTNSNPAQLSNPIHSTNYFSLATSDVFTNKYAANTNINLCGQCHNARGAAWTDTSSAPHHSLQYNFLLGSIGELLGGSATFNPGTHAGLPSSAIYSISGRFYLTNQCVSCHMQKDSSGGHNHSFEVTTNTVCFNCHVTDPEFLEQYFLTPAISNNVAVLLTALNRWAAIKAPAALRTNGAVIWEYTTPGGLIWQTNSFGFVTSWTQVDQVSFSGPNAAGQALIPNAVKRARFNMYLVLNDGSFGVHNPTLALNLLNAAEIWMAQVLQ